MSSNSAGMFLGIKSAGLVQLRWMPLKSGLPTNTAAEAASHHFV
jgi:hypothetical protein